MRFAGAILLLTMCLMTTIIPSTSINCILGCTMGSPDCVTEYTETHCPAWKKCTYGPTPDYYRCLDPKEETVCNNDKDCHTCTVDYCNNPPTNKKQE